MVSSSTPKARARKSAASRSNDGLFHPFGITIFYCPSVIVTDASMASGDHSMEMAEIDARLSALQHFMKKSLDSVRNTSNH